MLLTLLGSDGSAGSSGLALTFMVSEQVCGGREVGIFHGAVAGDSVGLLLGLPANRTFMIPSPGAMRGLAVGAFECVHLKAFCWEQLLV